MTNIDWTVQAVEELRNKLKTDAMCGFLTEEELIRDLTAAKAHADIAEVGSVSSLKIPTFEETDPNGVDQHTAGAKLDAGKVKAGLVLGDFSNALLAVSEVGTYGANKYTDHGWLSVTDGVNRYKNAMFRHMLKHNTGEAIDKETGLTHLAAVAWNVLAMLELTIREQDETNKQE